MKFQLANGQSIPALGKIQPKAIRAVLASALESGYRHFDCAYVYDNKREAGNHFHSLNIPRSELFLSSKHWGGPIPAALASDLKDYQTPYLDLYMLHWPVSYLQTNGRFVKDPITKQYALDPTPVQDKWKVMESLVEQNLVRSIGVSNFTVTHLKSLLKTAKIRPAVNQVELHPYLPQNELVEFCKHEGIHLTAYCPLGSGALLNDPVVLEIATRAGCSPAQVLLAWGIQRGTSVIPKSTHPDRIKQNAQLIELDYNSIQQLDGLHRVKTTRYISSTPFFGLDVFAQ